MMELNRSMMSYRRIPATSEECAAAGQEMSSEAENLREMIQKFKVAENKN